MGGADAAAPKPSQESEKSGRRPLSPGRQADREGTGWTILAVVCYTYKQASEEGLDARGTEEDDVRRRTE